MNKFLFIWLRRLFFKNLFQMENIVSLLGLSLAVLCLTVTMVVMSSYETTLKESLIAHTGHIHLIKREGRKAFFEDIKPYIQNESVLPFISTSALALSKGELSGVLMEGFSLNHTLKNRLIAGSLPSSLQKQGATPSVIGRGLARRFDLKINSSFYLAVPGKGYRSKLKKLQVSGIADLGRHELNSRYIAVSLQSAQNLLESSQLTGFRLFFVEENNSLLKTLKENLSSSYWVQDWKYIHKNLFTAIQMEKIIIFIVLLILVIAAGFNMSNQMLLQVLKRFHDIGILKTIGASPAMITQMFLIRTAGVSFLGILIGFTGAVLLCYVLFEFYNVWGRLIPSDVYELNQIILDFRGGDFLSIFIFSAFICLLSSWIPIKKALKLSPCEGLRFH